MLRATSSLLLRNLHRYHKARYDKQVKARFRYSHQWFLKLGNNVENHTVTAHEREATENFAVYRYDVSLMKWVLPPKDIRQLPPRDRLNELTRRMAARWKVKDPTGGYDRAKMMLEALECFGDLQRAGEIKTLGDLEENGQEKFFQYLDATTLLATKAVEKHPDAVQVIIRAAQIADLLECPDKRDNLLKVARRLVEKMGFKEATVLPAPEEFFAKSGQKLLDDPFLSAVELVCASPGNVGRRHGDKARTRFLKEKNNWRVGSRFSALDT